MSDQSQDLFRHLHSLLALDLNPVDQEQEIWNRFGRRVAVLVLDSSGFSRITESHGIVHFMSCLLRMRAYVQPIIEAHGQVFSKFEADNLVAAFEHPDAAIRAALAIHETVAANRLMLTDSEPFRVCIGIGYGDMLYSETTEGFFSSEMNLASKLGEDTAAGGETLLTVNVYEHADAALVRNFEARRIRVSGVDLPYYAHCHKD